MSQGIKSILTFVFFLLVFANIKSTLLQASPQTNHDSEMLVSNGVDSHVSHISVALDLSTDDSTQHSFDTEFASGYWKMFRGVLPQNTSFVESGFFQSPKSIFLTQAMCMIGSLQALQMNRVCHSISISTKPTLRYYIYTLRHILV